MRKKQLEEAMEMEKRVKEERRREEARLPALQQQKGNLGQISTGPAGLKYRIHYDHQAKNLVLRVIEGRVSPTQVNH